jgi:hypothetical protein
LELLQLPPSPSFYPVRASFRDELYVFVLLAKVSSNRGFEFQLTELFLSAYGTSCALSV